MAATTPGKTTPDEATRRSVSAAARDTALTGAEDAAGAESLTSNIGVSRLQSISRVTYAGSYMLAYGAVYAAVFIAQSLPQENPIMHGFRAGGRAAMEEFGG